MKKRNYYFLFIITPLLLIGCSCVVKGTRFHITSPSMISESQRSDFLLSFKKELEELKYSVRIISRNNIDPENDFIYASGETYLKVLEAMNESFSATSIVRVCEDQSKSLFVQVVRGDCSFSGHEESFKKDCTMIQDLLVTKFPSIIFSGGCPIEWKSP